MAERLSRNDPGDLCDPHLSRSDRRATPKRKTRSTRCRSALRDAVGGIGQWDGHGFTNQDDRLIWCDPSMDLTGITEAALLDESTGEWIPIELNLEDPEELSGFPPRRASQAIQASHPAEIDANCAAPDSSVPESSTASLGAPPSAAKARSKAANPTSGACPSTGTGSGSRDVRHVVPARRSLPGDCRCEKRLGADERVVHGVHDQAREADAPEAAL